MRHKFLTKLVLGALISTTLVGGVTTLSYAQSGQSEMVEHKTNQSFDQIKNEVEKYLVLNKDGTIGLSENIPSFYNNEEYRLDLLLKHFEVLNQKVLNGEISINSDFTINQPQVRAGQTYTKNHWWGHEYGFSYKHAVIEISNFRNAANFGVVAGTVAMVKNLLVGAGILGVSAWYLSYANSMEAHNNTNNQRGIVTNVNWSSYYTVYSQ